MTRNPGPIRRAVVCGYDVRERSLSCDACDRDEVVLYVEVESVDEHGFMDMLVEDPMVRLGVPGPGLWLWTGHAVTYELNTPDGHEFDLDFECVDARRLTAEEALAVAEGRNPLGSGRADDNLAADEEERIRHEAVTEAIARDLTMTVGPPTGLAGEIAAAAFATMLATEPRDVVPALAYRIAFELHGNAHVCASGGDPVQLEGYRLTGDDRGVAEFTYGPADPPPEPDCALCGRSARACSGLHEVP